MTRGDGKIYIEKIHRTFNGVLSRVFFLVMKRKILSLNIID